MDQCGSAAAGLSPGGAAVGSTAVSSKSPWQHNTPFSGRCPRSKHLVELSSVMWDVVHIVTVSVLFTVVVHVM